MPEFERYIGVDYSGAQTATSPLPGLRVYVADRTNPPKEEFTRITHHRNWTRRGVAEWLADQLHGPERVIAGIDHGFSFPRRYFEVYKLQPDWPSFLDDFQRHWPTDEDHVYVCFLRDHGNGRTGNPSWLRLTEEWARSAKSVFRFGVQGEVAASTHAGLPWLRYIRTHCRDSVHFWPFDGWEIPPSRSVVAEVYPSLWRPRFTNDGARNEHQHDAYAVSAWLQRADATGWLSQLFNPPLTNEERATARIEGWILGLV